MDELAKDDGPPEELDAELSRWLKETKAVLPVPNPDYDPAKESGRAGGRPASLRRTTSDQN